MSRTTAPPPEIVLTRFTNAGGPLTKQLSLSTDGTLVQNKSACKLVSGTAERVTVDGVDGLGALIEGLVAYRRALLNVRPHLAEMIVNVGRGNELP